MKLDEGKMSLCLHVTEYSICEGLQVQLGQFQRG